MAKDPAILWYWSDWNSGTSTLTRFLKGCYMDLLHAQYNSGSLSLEEIKTVLGADFGQAWPTLKKKFKADESGLFFNERLDLEKRKREAFTESRRKNRAKKHTLVEDMKNTSKTYVLHMENENEIRNIDRDIGGVGEKGKDCFPSCETFTDQPSEVVVGSIIQLVKITKQIDITEEDVGGLWEVFKVQNLTGKKFYASPGDVFTHFVNWAKTQKIDRKKTGASRWVFDEKKSNRWD